MTIFTSWKNSLAICSLKNSKLLWYAFMRSVRDLYILLWRNASNDILAFFALYVLEKMHLFYRLQQAEIDINTGAIRLMPENLLLFILVIVSWFVQAFIFLRLFFYAFLLARNSMQNKNVAYLQEWKKKYQMYFFGAIFIAAIVGLLCSLPFSVFFVFHPHFYIALYLYIFLISVFFKPFYFIFLFFLFDTVLYYSSMPKNKLYRVFLLAINAGKNSVKMVVYNLPLFFLIGSIANLLGMGLDVAVNVIPDPFFVNSINKLLQIVLVPVTICLYGVLYTKYSYEQIDLYTEGVKE